MAAQWTSLIAKNGDRFDCTKVQLAKYVVRRGLEFNAQPLRGKRILHNIDNHVALSALVNGYASKIDLAR